MRLLVWLCYAVALCYGCSHHGTLVITENNSGDTTASVTIDVSATSPETEITVQNRGDYVLTIPLHHIVGAIAERAVLIPTISKLLVSDGTTNRHATASAYRMNNEFGISIHQSPDGTEMNMDVSFAIFPFQRFTGGWTIFSNGVLTQLVTKASTKGPALVLGTDLTVSAQGVGVFDLKIPTAPGANTYVNSLTDGILLVAAYSDSDTFALSTARPNGNFRIFVHDNGVDGSVYVNEPFAFVYVPILPNPHPCVFAMGRIWSDLTPDISHGTFTLTLINTSTYRLTIPGHSPSSGTLIVTPEGGVDNNSDNIIVTQADGSTWLIQSLDLPASSEQDMTLSTDRQRIFNFVFLPFTANDKCEDSALLQFPTNTFTTQYAILNDDITTCTDVAESVEFTGPDVWFHYQSSQHRALKLSTCSAQTEIDTQLAVYQDVVGNEAETCHDACNRGVDDTPSCHPKSELYVSVHPNEFTRIRVSGSDAHLAYTSLGKVVMEAVIIETHLLRLCPGTGEVVPVGEPLIITMEFWTVPQTSLTFLVDMEKRISIVTANDVWSVQLKDAQIQVGANTITWTTGRTTTANTFYEVRLDDDAIRGYQFTWDFEMAFVYKFQTGLTQWERADHTIDFAFPVEAHRWNSNALRKAIGMFNCMALTQLACKAEEPGTYSTIVRTRAENLAKDSMASVVAMLSRATSFLYSDGYVWFRDELLSRHAIRTSIFPGTRTVIPDTTSTVSEIDITNEPNTVGSHPIVTVDVTLGPNGVNSDGYIELVYPVDWIIQATPVPTIAIHFTSSDHTTTWTYPTGPSPIVIIDTIRHTLRINFVSANLPSNVRNGDKLSITVNSSPALVMPSTCLQFNSWIWVFRAYSASNALLSYWMNNTPNDKCHGQTVVVFGDPHFNSFSGGYFDISGRAGHIYTIITDTNFLWNSVFVAYKMHRVTAGNAQMHTFLGNTGLLVYDHTIYLDPVNDTAWVDGQLMANDKRVQLGGRCFVKKEGGLAIIRAEGFRIALKRTVFGNNGHILPHYDHAVDLLREETHHPHGILGQTATFNKPVTATDHRGTGVLEGRLEDYEVPTILSTACVFNRYGYQQGANNTESDQWHLLWFKHKPIEGLVKGDKNPIYPSQRGQRGTFWVTPASHYKLATSPGNVITVLRSSTINYIAKIANCGQGIAPLCDGVSTMTITLSKTGEVDKYEGGSLSFSAESALPVVNGTVVSSESAVIGYIPGGLVSVTRMMQGCIIRFPFLTIYLRVELLQGSRLAQQMELPDNAALSNFVGVVPSLMHTNLNAGSRVPAKLFSQFVLETARE